MQKTVMIIDDSIPIHALVKKQLEADQFYFHSIYDGASAVAAAVAAPPDVILLDIDLPRIDGFEACRHLKRNPLTAQIPVIFLSANSLSDEMAKGLELGAIDFIVKPFKPDELRDRVRSALCNYPQPMVNQVRAVDQPSSSKAHFGMQLEMQLEQARRFKKPLSCMVGDLDCSGTIDSRAASQFVKAVIRSVATAFLLRCREKDTILQLENGRFIVLLADRTRYQAAKLAQRLHSDLEQQLLAARSDGVHITYSFGIADTCMTTGENLLERATIAAQRAGRRGGNRVAIARTRPVSQLAA